MSDENKATLAFSSRVLGKAATERLRDGEVSQTIRSRKSALPLFKYQGQDIDLTLDGQFLYRVHISSITGSVKLSDLTEDDASYGGFDSLKFGDSNLHKALKLAGWRFKEFYNYTAYRVRFQKVQDS